MYNDLLIGHLTIYLVGAVAALVLHKNNRLSTYAAFVSASVASIFGAIFAYSIIIGETLSFTIAGSSIMPVSFFIDDLAAFFILTLSIIVFAVSIYSMGYVKEYYGKKDIGYLGFLYNIFIISMILVIVAGNAIMFLIVWELMSILSYFLVIYEHEKEETRKAGFTYIVMTHVGTGFIIISFLTLAGATGSFNFDTFHGIGAQLSSLLKNVVFLTALIGFGTKAGIVPFHIWLPYAHPAAPSNVSALMSGVMIKIGVYMLIRVAFDFLGAEVLWWGVLVLVVGSVSALLGIIYAVVESDIKKMLAFSSIENIGIVFMGIGGAMIFMSSGYPEFAAFGLIAALYHVINHAVFKSLLFMGAGSILYSTHTKNIEKLGGLIKVMPWTAGFFFIGAMSISAIPPFNGFVSEWMLFQTLLQSIDLSNNIITIVVLFSGAGLALTGALAAMCFAKAFGICFLALPRSTNAEHAREVPASMLSGMGILSVTCLVLGMMPHNVVKILDSITSPIVNTNIISQLTPDYSVATVFSGFGSISTAWILLVMLILSIVIIILLPMRSRHKYETWGCGQPLSTARNEYTATAFTKPVKILFSSLYRGSRDIQTMYSGSRFFKGSIKFESHIEPIFERYLYVPLIDLIHSVSRTSKVIQAGSIHAYIAYVFVTLIILLMYVLLELEGGI
ncbi:MAG: hydrogenase 4 subunit B [Methanosarcinaceae archaeon]|nr:hydrogenase 4 subunit B [Methanosarcinaceae archaeon]